MVAKKKDTDVVTMRVPVYVAEQLSRLTPVQIVRLMEEAALTEARVVVNTMLEEPSKPVLQRANELIGGERQSDYGRKLQNFAQIAMLWQGTLATKIIPGQRITPEDIALCMMQVKIARLAKSPDHADSILDIAGYAGCYEAAQLERLEGDNLLGATEDARSPDGRL